MAGRQAVPSLQAGSGVLGSLGAGSRVQLAGHPCLPARDPQGGGVTYGPGEPGRLSGVGAGLP